MNKNCPSCGAGYNISPQHVGRQTICKKCGVTLLIEADGLKLAGPVIPPATELVTQDGGAPPRSRPGSFLKDFLAFRRMISVIAVQVIFWVGAVGCLVFGLLQVISGFRAPGGGILIGIGLTTMFVGPIVIRFYCEVMIVIFRMNETLTEIKNELQRKENP